MTDWSYSVGSVDGGQFGQIVFCLLLGSLY